jgi:threonine synthase
MQYVSTRGGPKLFTFLHAVKAGLAPDGGLLVPQFMPFVNERTLEEWRGLDYQDLSFHVLRLFIGADEISDEELVRIVRKSLAKFPEEPVKVVQVGSVHVLELFHGPTLAFKDFALQFLGALLEFIIAKDKEAINVVVATSGDTGSAAIVGLQDNPKIKTFVLYPHRGVSNLQERQMTCNLSDNVYPMAISGSFDDAQSALKAMFARGRIPNLTAVNSVNWARIAVQIVYYFYAYFRISPDLSTKLVFSVPTGNFGDVLAGWYAKRIGLPIERLIVATNDNNILEEFFSTGRYERRDELVLTVAPSMDIQVASNFERLLYYLVDEDPRDVRASMKQFSSQNYFEVSAEVLARATKEFSAVHVKNEDIKIAIRETHLAHQYLMDPHTAIAFNGAKLMPASRVVVVSTAHYGKFIETVTEAVGTSLPLPDQLQDLLELPKRFEVLGKDVRTLENYVLARMHRRWSSLWKWGAIALMVSAASYLTYSRY